MNITALGKAAEQLGLSCNKKGMIALGQYKGYKVVIKENAGVYNINFPIRTSDLTQGESMSSFISELLQEKKRIRNATYEGNSLKVDLAMRENTKKNILNITEFLEKIINFISRNFYKTSCEMCIDEKETEVYLINENAAYLCEECYGQVIQELDSRQESAKQRKGNLITGIVGAFLGSLIGVAVWVIIYALGYIAAIAGIILAVCIIRGYELFGGKLNSVGIVITVVMTIGMVYVATYVAYGYELYTFLKEYEEINLIQAISALGTFLGEYEEVRKEFIRDLALGYIFTAIGSISTFISAYKVSNNKYSAKRITQ